MLLMLLVVRIYGIIQFEEVCLVAGFTVSEADRGMGAGCVTKRTSQTVARVQKIPASGCMPSGLRVYTVSWF